MKKIYTYLAMFVAAATMVACENAPEGNVTPDATGKPIEITIGDLSRVMLGEDGKTITWKEGDVLGLFHVIDGAVSPTGNNSKYTVTAVSDDGKTATISGFITVEKDGITTTTYEGATWSGEEGEEHEFYIYYPYRDSDEGVAPTALWKTLTSAQKYNTNHSVWENFGGYIFAYGKATSYTYGEDVVFDAIDPYFGMLRLNITNNTGAEITISKVNLTNENEYLVGTHSIDLTKPNPDILYTKNQNHTIALTVLDGGTVADGDSIDIRFLMTPRDYSDTNFTVTVTSDQGIHPTVSFEGGNIAQGGRASKSITITKGYKIGDVFKNEGVEGVIFWISADKTNKAKIVAGPSAKKAYCTNKTTVTNTTSANHAENLNDGTRNMALVKAVDPTYENHPAFKYCADMGEGWYLPARREVKALIAGYHGVATYDEVSADGVDPATPDTPCYYFNSQLKSLTGGVALDSKSGGGDSVFTSNEKDAANAYYFNVNKKQSDPTGAKTSTSRYARCIKVVELTE